MEQLEVETPFTCNGRAVVVSTRRPTSRCCSCCASGSASSRSRTAARRKASAGAARCSSTASHASRASRRSRASRDARSRRSKGSTPSARDRLADRVRRDRRIAVRVLHAGHRHARVGRAGPRSRPRAGRAPVPVHRLAHGLRRDPRAPTPAPSARTARDLDAAARRAELEGGVAQAVRRRHPARRRALRRRHRAARRARRGSAAARLGGRVGRGGRDAMGGRRVVGRGSRARPGKVQGRRTTVEERPPLFDALPALPAGGVRLATSWVEPAYLEPDASWCEPGGEPASPYVNGGAFGGKLDSAAPRAARELADRLGAVGARRLLARRRRAPRAEASADRGDGGVARRPRRDRRRGRARRRAPRSQRAWPSPYCVRGRRRAGARSTVVGSAGRHRAARAPVSPSRRCSSRARSTRPASTARRSPTIRRCSTRACWCRRVRARARGCTSIPTTGALERVEVRVAAGDPLDEIVLRSYAIGAAHMALGWVCTESLTVDPATGEVHDLTIRSFGILRAKDMPPVDVAVVDDGREPLAGVVRRGVRRGRGRRVERARPRGGHAAGYVPGSSDARRAPTQEVAMPVVPVPTPSAPPVAGPYSPAVRAGDWLVLAGQVGLDPATGDDGRRRVEAQARQVLANIAGDPRRLRRVADRRRQDHRVRHRHRRLRRPSTRCTPRRSATTARPARPCRSPHSPPAPRSRSKSGPTSPNANLIGR